MCALLHLKDVNVVEIDIKWTTVIGVLDVSVLLLELLSVFIFIANGSVEAYLAHFGEQPVGALEASRSSEEHNDGTVLGTLFCARQLVVVLVQLHERGCISHEDVKVEVRIDLAHGRADAFAHLDARLFATLANHGKPFFKVNLSTQLKNLLVSARAEVESIVGAETVADDAPKVEQCVKVLCGEVVKSQLLRKEEKLQYECH